MNVESTIKRIWFETLLFILFPILMIYQMILVYILATIECFKVYPPEIYRITKLIVYGKENS